MATKRQIAEQAMRILSGGNPKPDNPWDIREFMLVLDQLRDYRCRIDTFNNVKMGEYRVDEDYLSFYESVSVSTDAVKSLKYITLPADPISLPYGLGLYQITPIGDMEDAYIIIPAGSAAIYSGTQALEHELKVFCWQVGGIVYFKNIDAAVSEVTVLMAASSKSITESATYPVPPDVEAELLQQLVQTFDPMRQIPHDEMDDGKKA